MIVSVSPNQSAINSALRAFLLSIMPSGMEVVEGQQNYVAEPIGPDFIIFWPILRNRISTNWDYYVDDTFVGSISGNTLTITAVNKNPSLQVGSPIFGPNVTIPTSITAFGTGTGGIGTYTVDTSQNVASGLIASGSSQLTQPTQITVQLDVHGPNSPDYAEIISTTFRDGFAVDQMGGNAGIVCPLYADDPKEVPFLNAEQQYEKRWIVDTVFQCNQIVTITGQQFATQVIVTAEPIPETLGH